MTVSECDRLWVWTALMRLVRVNPAALLESDRRCIFDEVIAEEVAVGAMLSSVSDRPCV